MQRLPEAVLVGIVSCWTGAGVAHAQTAFSVHIDAGVVGSTSLVRDSIVQPFSIGPAAAPTVGVAADARLDPHYRVGFEVQYARSDLVRRESGTTTTVLPLTVWSGFLTLRRAIIRRVSVAGRIGAVSYVPSGEARFATFFGTERPLLAAAGASAHLALPAVAHVSPGVTVRYDLHRFNTIGLREQGISGHRTVHRASLLLTLGLGRVE